MRPYPERIDVTREGNWFGAFGKESGVDEEIRVVTLHRTLTKFTHRLWPASSVLSHQVDSRCSIMEAHRTRELCRIAIRPLLSKRISMSFVRRPHRRSVVLTHTLDIFVNNGCFLFVVRLRQSCYILLSFSFPTGSGADLSFFPRCNGNVGSLRTVVNFRWQLRQMYPFRRA